MKETTTEIRVTRWVLARCVWRMARAAWMHPRMAGRYAWMGLRILVLGRV